MGTILVVDDNAAVARMLARFLETKGHHAVVAHNGPDALAAAGAQPPPDLILLDLSMPEMDGMEVLRRLQTRNPHAPGGEVGGAREAGGTAEVGEAGKPAPGPEQRPPPRAAAPPGRQGPQAQQSPESEIQSRQPNLPPPSTDEAAAIPRPTSEATAPRTPPVIFFSAVDDPAVIASALKHGAREYWVKASFKFDDLPKAIERYVPAPKS